MKPLYKILTFEALVVGYVLLAWDGIISAPFIYVRLLLMFLAGAINAVFVEGPTYGVIHPVSSRPVMIFVGVVLMGGSLLWSFALRGHM